MMPLGLHHIMGWDHHYGPGPWVTGGRPDWTALYYHQADSLGIGFDRTSSGSNALGQYAPEIVHQWSDPNQIPEKYLLWFHHLPWDFELKSGKTLWEEIGLHYDQGVKTARKMQETWASLESELDPQRFDHVRQLLVFRYRKPNGGGIPVCSTSRLLRSGHFQQKSNSQRVIWNTIKAYDFPLLPGSDRDGRLILDFGISDFGCLDKLSTSF